LLEQHISFEVKRFIWHHNNAAKLIKRHGLVKGDALTPDVDKCYQQMRLIAVDLECVKHEVYRVWPTMEGILEKLLQEIHREAEADAQKIEAKWEKSGETVPVQ
jgi:hypothetical protein